MYRVVILKLNIHCTLYRLDFTERQLELMTAEMKDKITAIVEDVEYKVTSIYILYKVISLQVEY